MHGAQCAATAICNMFTLRDFTAQDLPEAGKIALQLWGNEVPDMPPEVRKSVYDYLARYYFNAASPFNLAAACGGRLQALLLASDEEFVPPPLPEDLPEAVLKYLTGYRKYLDGNRHLEKRYTRYGDVQLLFFASIRPGCGKLLMDEFIRRLRQYNYNSMILWSDNTCNYQYYLEHGFELLHRQIAEPGLENIPLETMIFRKELA